MNSPHASFRGGAAATVAALTLTIAGVHSATATPLVLSPSAVTINQVDFRGGVDSLVAELTIDRTLALSSGYINVIDPITNAWVVRNFPVFDSLGPYDQATLTSRMDLSFTGIDEGTSLPPTLDLIVDFNTDPSGT